MMILRKTAAKNLSRIARSLSIISATDPLVIVRIVNNARDYLTINPTERSATICCGTPHLIAAINL
jgi:hypothetical protein